MGTTKSARAAVFRPVTPERRAPIFSELSSRPMRTGLTNPASDLQPSRSARICATWRSRVPPPSPWTRRRSCSAVLITPIRGVRGGIRQLGTTALLPTGFYEQPRVAMTNSVCNCGRDSTRQPGPATDRYGNLHTSRFVRPLAGCATLISIEEFVLVAQNVRGGAAAASVVGFRRWPRRTAGRGLGSLSRFGDGVESVCCGGPQSSVGCGVRGRPSVIASPGSLQRHPARTGIDRNVRSKEHSRAQEVQAPQLAPAPKWATTLWPTRRAPAGSTTAPS